MKHTKINTLALPALLHANQHWTITAREGRRITAAEMKYVYEKNSRVHLDRL